VVDEEVVGRQGRKIATLSPLSSLSLSSPSSPNAQCQTTLRPARPYEGTIITGIKGLTEAEVSTLKALGAVEVKSGCSIPVNFR